MKYNATCPKCNWFESDYNNPREDMCGDCVANEYSNSHNGVDRVTDLMYPGLKNMNFTDEVDEEEPVTEELDEIAETPDELFIEALDGITAETTEKANELYDMETRYLAETYAENAWLRHAEYSEVIQWETAQDDMRVW